MKNLEIEAVFPYLHIPALQMWEELITFCKEEFPSEAKGSLYAESHTFAKMGEAITKRGRPFFNIESEFGNFRYSSIGNARVSFLRIGGQVISSDSDAIKWMNQISCIDGFIMGRAFDSEFEYWQNAENPLLFEFSGRSTEGLSWKNNGLPAPLNDDIIDISQNPGRRVLRDGYVEAVGHLMWIGDAFWNVTQLQTKSAPDWVEHVERLDGADFIVVSTDPFCEGMKESYSMLDRIREYYFPRN